MPHDRNLKEIEVGDMITSLAYNDTETDINKNKIVRFGIVIDIRSNEQECTGQFLYLNNDSVGVIDYFGAKDSLLVIRKNFILNYGSIDAVKFKYKINI